MSVFLFLFLPSMRCVMLRVTYVCHRVTPSVTPKSQYLCGFRWHLSHCHSCHTYFSLLLSFIVKSEKWSEKEKIINI